MLVYIISILAFNFFYILFHKKIALLINIYDKPDTNRKFHKTATPITGGLLIFLNVCIYFIYFALNKNNELVESYFFENFRQLTIFFASSFLFFLIGIYDDKKSISALKKFFFIIIVILPIIVFLDNSIIYEVRFSFMYQTINLHKFGIFWTLLCFLLFMNAYNMFDGINLQASTYILFLSVVIFFFSSYDLLLLTLIISLIVFIFLNYRSKSFLGDGGTLFLSFIIGIMFIKLYNSNQLVYSDHIVLLMIIPGLELIRLFISRLSKKQNPFSPDRNHIHHLLLKKFSLIKVNLIIQTLIIFPYLLSLFIGYTFIILMCLIVSYFILIYKFN